MSVGLHLAKADLEKRVPEADARVWVYYVWHGKSAADRTWILNNRVPEGYRKWVIHECKRLQAAKKGGCMATFDRVNGVYRRSEGGGGARTVTGAPTAKTKAAEAAGQQGLF